MVHDVLADVDESVGVAREIELSLLHLVSFPPSEQVDVAEGEDDDRGYDGQDVHVALQLIARQPLLRSVVKKVRLC